MEKNALTRLTHGVYVVGCQDIEKGRFCGLVADAVMQVANRPVIVALSLMNSNYTCSQIGKTGRFSLSVLGEKVAPFIVANFGYQSGRNVDKWRSVKYKVDADLPYLTDALACLEARVIKTEVFESHTLFLAQITDAWEQKKGKPLTYFEYQTTFKNEVLKSFKFKIGVNKMEKNEKWVCVVCGYVYDGDVPFEELPDDWTCPLCGVGKDMFEKREV